LTPTHIRLTIYSKKTSEDPSEELIGAPFKKYFTDPERAEAGIMRVLSGSKVSRAGVPAPAWSCHYATAAR